MKVVALSCPQCGGTQEVPAEDEFLVCTYCQARLKVTRDDKGWLMKLLDETRLENRELAFENEVLRLQNAIHQLDAKWENLRRSMLVKTRRGEREPSLTLAQLEIAGAIFIPIFSVLVADAEARWEALIGGLIGGFILFAFGWIEFSSGREFRAVRARYTNRRAELSRELIVAQGALRRPVAKPTP